MNESTKNCGNCRYEDVDPKNKPCIECYDSFCDIPFPNPSEWEEKLQEAT